MRNLGSRVEKRWGLQPGPHAYIVWLGGPATGTMQWTIKGLGVQLSGPYRGCGFHTASTSKANFGTCAENPLLGPARTTRGPSAGGTGEKDEHVLLDMATGPAWISCTEGCCTTDAT